MKQAYRYRVLDNETRLFTALSTNGDIQVHEMPEWDDRIIWLRHTTTDRLACVAMDDRTFNVILADDEIATAPFSTTDVDAVLHLMRNGRTT